MAKDQMKQRKLHFAKYSELEAEYTSYQEPKARLIRDYIFPEGARFVTDNEDPSEGRLREENIIDSTASQAHATHTSGLAGVVTSPDSDWFRVDIEDKELREVQSVKEYFDRVNRIMRSDLANSNFYTQMKFYYATLIAFSTASIHVDQDFEKVYHFTAHTTGQYFIDKDAKGNVIAIYRKIKLRAREIIEEYGEENVSRRLKAKIGGGRTGGEWVDVLHVIEKNVDRDVTKLDSKNKPFKSTHYEFNGTVDEPPLRVSGYDNQPFAVGRYSQVGQSAYGVGSPGEMAIGHVLELQQLKKDYLAAVGKQVDKPVQAPSSMRSVSINAGAQGITYYNDTTGGKPPISPLYEINLEVGTLLLEIQELQNKINEIFLVKLFAMLIDDTTKRTATEARIREGEKLRLLGPEGERVQSETLQPILERCYLIGDGLGRFGEPPPEIQGINLKIEIISLASQARKLSEITPIERVVANVMGMADRWPEVIDKVNADQIVDIIASLEGIPADAINSDEIVDAIRMQRAQAMAQAEAQQQAQMQIDNAQKLSQTDVGGNNALTALAGAA